MNRGRGNGRQGHNRVRGRGGQGGRARRPNSARGGHVGNVSVNQHVAVGGGGTTVTPRRGLGAQRARGFVRGRGRQQNSANRFAGNQTTNQSAELERGESDAKRNRGLGYQRLKRMEENDDPKDILLFLSSTQSGLEELLSGAIRGGMTEMLLKVFAKMLECDEPQWCVQKMLQMILHGNFLGRAIRFIYEVFTEDGRKEQMVLLVSCTLKLTKSLLIVLPSDAEKEAKVTMKMLQTVVLGLGDESGELKDEYDEVNDLLGEVNVKQAKKREQKQNNEDVEDELHLQEAPSDFRTIPVFPQLKDIKGDEEVFLRTNLTHKAYLSADHYLDVQFRLLREDFIRPLREGIEEVIEQGANPKHRLQNVKVYENVKVEFIKPDQKGILHRIHFSTEKFENIRWHNTKRLLYGNLLCLSSDKFNEDVIFAVVADRKPEDLANGYLSVQFVYEQDEVELNDIPDEEDDEVSEELLDEDVHSGDEVSEELLDDEQPYSGVEFEEAQKLQPQNLGIRRQKPRPRADSKKVYTMVETDAYFEAYRHVLAGLQETENIPLERYIVSCSENMHAPEYLRPSVAGLVNYDFSPVCKTARTVTLLEDTSWPSPEQLSLNDSQAQALKLALTNELAIIQGPPGTGKTHVGLEIMKILLNNKTKWITQVRSVRPSPARRSTHCPILIVCYTNHALDQFLEGIAKFSGKDRTIVRVGGQSKNEVTKQFSLFEIRRKQKQSQGRSKRGRAMRHAIWDANNNLRTIQAKLQANIDKLEASLHCIHKLSHIKDYIPSHLYDQFHKQHHFMAPPPPSPDEVLILWLGLASKAVEPRQDFTHLTYGLHPFSVQFLQRNGYSLQDIGMAVHATGNADPMILYHWLYTTSQMTGRVGQRSEQVMEYDDGIDEEAELLQSQRLIEPDEYERRGSRANQQNDKQKHVNQLINEMSALTFQEIMVKDAEPDKEGFKMQRHQKRKLNKKVKKELGRTTTMTDYEEAQVYDINSLAQEDRWRLYRTWVARWRDQFRVGSDQDIEQYNTFAKRLEELRKLEDAEILRSADVVAVTTTGAAKYRDLIYRLNTKIVVVEEAAEVLEAHIITSMPRDTKHLILIGDHQQLKPSPTVYQLAKHYNLDMSLFERLIKVGVPHVTLACQHRMRPEIADLIRPHIYKQLGDHESVEGRDEITGVQKSMFFVSHNVQEESIRDGKSKKNQHEADFLVALAKYLILQGYAPEQITILAMYTGQIFAFKNVMQQKMCKGVRVTAVDNFQGEENDIILLSLVRSNAEGSIGFLKIDNRICVALSRAKNALYCIGNMELLQRKSPMWRNITKILHDKECIGEALTLQCKNHPDRHIEAKEAKDFHKAPEGGCGQPCGARLDCGHTCPRFCHPNNHSKQKCQKPCDKMLECGHKCKKKCNQACQPCMELVPKTMPECDHVQKVPCSKDVSEVKCKAKVEAKLPCDHDARVECWETNLVTMAMCTEKCPNMLECGHMCKGSCKECYQGRLHVPCLVKCKRTLVCGHQCKSFCTHCPPCVEECRTRCKHNKCKKKCGEPCVPCQENCQWKCEHYQCTKKCSEPCDRPPCNRPCTKLLKCKHACIGLCGEPCPDMCRVCNGDKVKELFFGDEDDPLARFVLLEDCGHIFTYQALDKRMNQKEEGDAVKMKECPRCKVPIWRSTRYGNIVNKLANTVNEVKKKIWGDQDTAASSKILLFDEVTSEVKKAEILKHEMRKITEELQGNISPSEVVVLEHRFRKLQKLQELKKAKIKLEKTTKISREFLFGMQIEKTTKISPEKFSVIDRDWNNIVKWVCLYRTHSSTQDEEAFSRETKRLKKCLKFFDMEAKSKSNAKERFLLSYFSELRGLLIDSIAPYDDEKQAKVQDLFKKLLALAPELISNLGISNEEKKMICEAMGFNSKGHWYKCSNGHIYAIGECGGATETSACPECKERIGGSGHRVLESNSIATEMDGATRSAYDAAATWNYIPEDLREDLARDGFM